jgi:RluA family pseudouridine synthase
VSATIKLSSPATHEFWEIPVLYEDADLLALDKPSGLLTSPDASEPDRPSLTKLVHASIERGAPWAKEGNRAYLMPAHRADAETSGVLLLAKSKPVLVTLVDWFSAEKPGDRHLALVQGTPPEDKFTVDAKMTRHPIRLGFMRVDSQRGKRSRTVFEVREKFAGYALLQCEALTRRLHQIRVHLRFAGMSAVGDMAYGGRPLLLSSLKRDYRLKPNQIEHPLIARAAIHAEVLTLPHPITGETVTITAPWPKDLTAAVKYLRRYAVGSGPIHGSGGESLSPALES